MQRGVLLIALFLCVAARVANGDHWAVLVAGSNGYGNYRHQADVAHAYNLLLANNFKADHIITFLYDDIANNTQNPFPGQIFNHPTDKGVPGVDVYAAIKGKIDYTGRYVTAKNFLAVLKGNASATTGGSGKVLKSGKSDTVFINFSDHGGTGLIAFPNDYLYVEDLTAALKYMFNNGMYGQLVFYLEACESGSMFEKQGWENFNAYGLSASLPDEDSWGYYCSEADSGPGGDFVNGKEIGSCLGDFFSVNWMEDSDKPTIKTETLAEQYQIVYKETAVNTSSGEFESHPQQYGSIADYRGYMVLHFIGNSDTASRAPKRRAAAAIEVRDPKYAVKSVDATLRSLYTRYNMAVKSGNIERINLLSKLLQEEIQLRTKLDNVFAKLTQQLGGEEHARELLESKASEYESSWSEASRACYREVVDAFSAEDACGMNDYNVKYTRVLSNICAHATENGIATGRVVRAVQTLCESE